MMILIITLFGVIAFSRLGLDMMPELEYPAVSVVTTYEGVSSEDIENLITKPIEGVVSSVKNVKNVTSTSQEGVSAVIVEFEWGVTLDFAAQDVREKLSWLTDYLPDEADSPLVVKFNTSDYPILYYGVTGMEDTRSLRKYLIDNIKPRLERLEGVASVYVMGGLEREINISVDRDKLGAFNLSMEQVIDRLARENVNVSGGHVEKGNVEYLVRTMGEYKDIEAIRNTVVTMHGKTSVYIKDVATVTDTFKESRNYGRTNKKPSVIMMVMKQSGKNTVTVIDNVKETLADLEGRIPADITFYPVMDQGRLIKRITRNTGRNAVVGAILAIIMVFAFLWNWRPTVTIGLAVPLSIITTAIGIYAFDYTLNIMTLGGMALGVGMLVDNAVVVIENIFRHLEEGRGREDAAIAGAEEVGMAITASTLTTISVFLPMALAGGIAGRLARPLAVTITLALLASLFVAVTIVPMLASVFFKMKEEKGKRKKKSLRLFSKIKTVYAHLLRWSLGHRLTVIAMTTLLFAVSVTAIPLIGTEFMPKGDFPILALKAELPVGTSLKETNMIIKRVENTILDQPETIFLASFIGLSRESKFDIAWGTGAADVNEALLYARLADKEMRVRSV
ncbi:MAG: efflux RND transporter permease subunit, partial [Syntrophaceae bacterium]|nr:efflux RND transporter permease subunit [Syntrophaceae bacterium]